ncbi:hypothetical protein BKA65DRAFT_584945 [Rhexocercosporidium sp. MPI-PUGE-AT-0058]|nr:hypothetical protein BKA65DRAFT_584945 [Rhexocercosporidium sp. MPI-PUGE-AT-0058]
MANYQEFYMYDAATNFQKTVHVNDGNSALNWTGTYNYLEQSTIQPNKTCNKLSSTSSGNRKTTNYKYDEHGNMTRMPHLGGSGSATNMDQRVGKIIERGPHCIEERIYLGDMELYRKRNTTKLLLERETLHVHDDHGRITLVESRSGGSSTTDRAPARLIRYQLTDHLDSSALEVDDEARVLTYEEYAAYGSTTYQAKSASLKTPKRYRYTGKERDEESGFSQHGARYLAIWLGRWLTTDPGGLADGGKLYAFQMYGLTIDEIHPISGTKLDPMSGPQSIKDAYWRATSPDNNQFLWDHHNSARKGGWDFYADNKLVDEAPATGSSIETDPAAMLDKNWSHTEEMKKILSEAMDNLRKHGDPDYPNLKTEEAQMTSIDEAGVLNKGLNRATRGVIKSSPSTAASAVRNHIQGNLNGVAQKGSPLMARLSGPPKWSRPGESPAPPETTPASEPATPEPAKPTETAPIESPPATEVAEGSGKVYGYSGMVGAADAVLRDVDKRNFTGAAKTSALVGGLAAVAKYGTKFGALGKFAGSKVPIIGWGLMAYGPYQNLSSNEAHASLDAASSWVTQHTDSKVLGVIAGGGAQPATAAYKTVVSDTMRDIKDGAGVLVSWGKKLF